MNTPCKNCKCLSHSDYPAQHSPIRFDEFGEQLPGGNEKWLCFKCDAEICVHCYMRHINDKHIEMYSCKCFTCKTMTKPEDFREYNWCVKCLPEKKDTDT